MVQIDNLQFQGQNCIVIVTSVVGHIKELTFRNEVRKWESVDPIKLIRDEEVFPQAKGDKQDIV